MKSKKTVDFVMDVRRVVASVLLRIGVRRAGLQPDPHKQYRISQYIIGLWIYNMKKKVKGRTFPSGGERERCSP